MYDLFFTNYTYKEVKDRELNQGLDLKGGINVTLQISIKDILKELSDGSKNVIFEKSLADADKGLRETSNTYLDLFFDAFEKNGGKLAAPDVFGNKNLSGQINYQMTNEQVKPIIRKKVDESVVSAFEVLRKRIDKFGVSNPNIQRLGNSGRILVELPGAKNIDRVKKLLQGTAQLEFWETYKASDFVSYFDALNAHFKSVSSKETSTEKQKTAIDTLSGTQKVDSTAVKDSDPIYDLIKLGQGVSSPSLGYFLVSDTTKLMSYIRSEEGKRLLPTQLKFARFAFGKPHTISDLPQLYNAFVSVEQEKANPTESKKFREELEKNLKKSGLIELYALRGNRENIAPLSGGVITDAVQNLDPITNQALVSMSMDLKGAKIWEALTGKAFAENGNIAIVLDNIVYSAPAVNGVISGGNSQITGNFSIEEAQDLANVLRAGKLPASADVVQSEIVGPSLGQEAINSGMMSFLIAGFVVFAWMFLYYGKAGTYANLALLLNILLIFGILASIENAVLTLPGIAGIVLTVGMSIDANVIIFERIKEELNLSKTQEQAVKDGFSNALLSILDANITTFLTAVVLLMFGSGPVKGFATTLIIGIITSLFTAIAVTRLFIDADVNNNKKIIFWTPPTKNFLMNVNMNFIGLRKISYVISGILIAISLISIFARGFDEGIDFAGGRSYQVRFVKEVKTSEVANALKENLGGVQIKTFGAANQVKITTKYKVQEESTEVDNEIQHFLYRDLKPYIGDISYEEFMSGEGIGIMKSDKVGPSIAEDIKENAVYAILGSLIIIFAYILLRFKKWQFSLGAVAALTHDVLCMLGIFSLLYSVMPFSLEIDQSFIAAVLTVIGYSLNDTVIIFDRIREFAKKGLDKENLNKAMNSTLSRTLNTSLTTFIVLLTIFIFGGESLRGFMFAMIIGVVVGTYSSIFVATPIVYDTLKEGDKLPLADETTSSEK